MTTPEARWRKSTYSGGDNNCVELAELADGIAIRDSKNPHQPPLLFPRPALSAFLTSVKQGEFDCSERVRS